MLSLLPLYPPRGLAPGKRDPAELPAPSTCEDVRGCSPHGASPETTLAPDLGRPASRTGGSKFLLFLSHPGGGACFPQQPEQSDAVGNL